MFRTYYHLTKPGIIYGNLLNTAAGFLFASTSHFDVVLFVLTLLGVALVIASACVVNNYMDREIDKKMARTKKRALATGAVSARAALTYAVVLGAAGFAILAVWTNWLVVLLGAIAMFTYLIPYAITKRQTVYGTVVGSIAGALPPVAGYCAVTGEYNLGAWLLFLIFVLWQMPHFYTIAIYRFKDYSAAGLPVLPVKQGMRSAKLQTVAYIAAFLVANVLLSLYGYAGYTYLLVMAAISVYWLAKSLDGFRARDDVAWGRSLFFLSLKVILALDVMLAAGARLP